MVTPTRPPLRLLLLAAALLALAAPASAQRYATLGSVPEGARVKLELDKPQYFLGENVLVHVCLENAGDKPFSYSDGGDYRGGSRHFRFKVTAIGPDGHSAADPDPSGFNMGGMESTPVLEPGEKIYWSLPLIRYCRLDEPGTYTVSIHHDFGWTETPQQPYPVGTIKILFIMPTSEQARQVVQDMGAHPPPVYGVWGEKSAPYADFSALRYPVYLPLLKDRAQSQDQKTYETALQGIGSIPTPEATQALLDLAGDPDIRRAVQALETLDDRLPDPAARGRLHPRSVFRDPTLATRLALSQAAWRPQFTSKARSLARRLLASPDTDAVICAAYILECVGTRKDLPALTSALDTAIQKAPALPAGGGNYPRTYGACTELERATLARIQEGAHVSAAPRAPAEQDEYLQALTAQPPQRPSDWPSACLTMLDSPSAYIRARTLETLATLAPLPPALADTLVKSLPMLLLDPDEDIQVAACHVAQKIKDPSLRAPVLQAMSQAQDFPLPNDLTYAAVYQGARWEVLKFWANRLDDPKQSSEALRDMQFALSPGQAGVGSSNGDTARLSALKTEWNTFLVAHRQEIQDGKTYALNDPEMQSLFPETIYSLRNESR